MMMIMKMMVLLPWRHYCHAVVNWHHHGNDAVRTIVPSGYWDQHGNGDVMHVRAMHGCYYCPAVHDVTIAMLIPMPRWYYCSVSTIAMMMSLPRWYYCPVSTIANMMPMPRWYYCPNAGAYDLMMISTANLKCAHARVRFHRFSWGNKSSCYFVGYGCNADDML